LSEALATPLVYQTWTPRVSEQRTHEVRLAVAQATIVSRRTLRVAHSLARGAACYLGKICSLARGWQQLLGRSGDLQAARVVTSGAHTHQQSSTVRAAARRVRRRGAQSYLGPASDPVARLRDSW